MSKQLEQRLAKAQASQVKRYSIQHVNVGENHYHLNVVPTGSLMIDYKTGIGGFPYGHAVEVYGANRLGKSSAIGYAVCGNVQKQGKLPAIIASEPRLVTPEDKEWALKLGFDPDLCLTQYPDHEEEAFSMLRDLVFDNMVDYIMIDSLGGLGTVATAKKDGKTAKAYGISGATTAVLNDIMPRVWKNNIGLLIINQQRQAGSFNNNTLYDSPGGEALHHHMRMRIQIKPGTPRFHAKIDGENLLVGRELICKFVKNNMSEGLEKTAAFNFFHIETKEYGFGIDFANDIVNVGKLTGVLDGSGWIEHPSFPLTKKGEHKIQGVKAVGDFLKENPKALEQIRNEVMAVMIQRNKEAAEEQAAEALEAEVTQVNETEETDE